MITHLSARSGDSNACTGSISTNYYFEVAAKPGNGSEQHHILEEDLDDLPVIFQALSKTLSASKREYHASDFLLLPSVGSDSRSSRESLGRLGRHLCSGHQPLDLI